MLKLCLVKICKKKTKKKQKTHHVVELKSHCKKSGFDKDLYWGSVIGSRFC